MSESIPPSVAPVSRVVKRDGTQEPFEASKIRAAVFAVTEQVGSPDAFLAGELTEGILHFLAQDLAGSIPTTAQLRELIVKVIRELGHPELAQIFQAAAAPKESIAKRGSGLTLTQSSVFEQGLRHLLGGASPPSASAVARHVWEHFGPGIVFARDLLAAQTDGLLTLGVGSSSVVLSALAMPQQAGKISESVDWLQKVWLWRHPVGETLIYDGPDHYQALDNRTANKLNFWLPRHLAGDLVETAREGIINLNAQFPPQEMVELARGPLFKNSPPSSDERLEQFTGDFLEKCASHSMPRFRVYFHLAARDFEEGKRLFLLRAVRLVDAGAAISFVFDRPRKPHYLGEGLDRSHKACLMSLGIHLPQLADQMGSPRTQERFLSKLVILVRLALTAGAQKRAFLRRYSEGPFAEGFLLEKARLVLVPVGLDEVVRSFCGEGCSSSNPAPLEFGSQILERIRTSLSEDGKAYVLDTCLDSSNAPANWLRKKQGGLDARFVAGVTTWDEQAAPMRQMTACGTLHRGAQGGTARILLPDRGDADPEELARWLEFAWKKTDIVSLCFDRHGSADLEKGSDAERNRGAK